MKCAAKRICERCTSVRGEHSGDACPDGSGRTFKPRTRAYGAGTSFDEPEIDVLEGLLGAAKGGNGRDVLRHPRFSGVARKVLAMRESARAYRQARDAGLLGQQQGYAHIGVDESDTLGEFLEERKQRSARC